MLGLSLIAAACGGSSASPSSRPASCAATPVRRGGMPAWTAAAFGDSSSQFAAQVPYAVSSNSRVVAVLFSHPLRAGVPRRRGNKILWIVREPRDGKPLRIHAVPATGSAHPVSSLWPANSSPGEIYPSLDNVPAAGCWIFTLRWNGHTDTIALPYTAGTPG